MLAIAALIAVAALPSVASAGAPNWRTLGPGADYAAIAVAPRPAIGDGLLHVVRVDPARATLRPRLSGEAGGEPRTARQWADGPRIVAAINAGMFATDFSTHTGYLRVGERVHSSRWVSQYQSVLLIGPRRRGLPAAAIRDAHQGEGAAAFADYDTVIQNLRLIRNPGVNVWSQSPRRWSEAAIALDREGRVLLLFCRSPFTMYDFNALLKRLPLGIVRAMHVEGGPEASLSVRGPGIVLDLHGSYETGFHESDDNDHQWPLPNVVVVEVRAP